MDNNMTTIADSFKDNVLKTIAKCALVEGLFIIINQPL